MRLKLPRERRRFRRSGGRAADGMCLACRIRQAPARQAGFNRAEEETPATTVNKVCGSGMKTVMLGHDAIKAGGPQLVVAGGMKA